MHQIAIPSDAPAADNLPSTLLMICLFSTLGISKASAPAIAIAGVGPGGLYVGGFVGCYLYYEWLHRRLHTHSAISAYGRWARRHHFWHHFHDPRVNHGVTSPVWDIVFRTHVPVAQPIRVPEKLAMPWLLNAETHEIRSELEGRWELRRKRRAAA